MSIRLFSACLTLNTWPVVNTRICAPDSWLMLCHVRERDPDLWIGTAFRAPHHNATEPRGTDPNRANGSRSWAPNRPSVSLSAPVSSSDPNTNWHLINILSEGFISLTSCCLSSSPLKTTDALITQNSICVRERPATRTHRLKWAAQNGWMHIPFHLEKRSFSYYRLSCHCAFNSHCAAYLIFHFIFSYYSEKEHPALRRETRWASLFLKSSQGSVTNKRCPGWLKEKCSSNL